MLENVLPLYSSITSLYKNEDIACFLECFKFLVECFANCGKSFECFYASFLIMLEKVLSLYSSIKSLYKNEDIAVFFLECLQFLFEFFANCGKSFECFMQAFL